MEGVGEWNPTVLTTASMSGYLNDVMKVQKKHVKIDFQSRLPLLFLEVSVTVCRNKKNKL